MKLPTFAGRFAHEAHLLSVGSTEVVAFVSTLSANKIQKFNAGKRYRTFSHEKRTTTNMEYFSNDFYLH